MWYLSASKAGLLRWGFGKVRKPKGNSLIGRLKTLAGLLKRELVVYRLVLKDRRTPIVAKVLLGLAVGYVLLPFDLIPDWIPVIGHLDDVILVPLLVLVALTFIPQEVMDECRARAAVGTKS